MCRRIRQARRDGTANVERMGDMAQVNEGPDVAAGQRVAEGQRVVKVTTADAIRNQKPRADVSLLPDPPMQDLPGPTMATSPPAPTPQPPPPPEAGS